MANLADALTRAGRADEAEPLAREALERRMSTLGERHPESMQSLLVLGATLRALGDDDEARAHLERCATLATSVFGAEHWLAVGARLPLRRPTVERDD